MKDVLSFCQTVEVASKGVQCQLNEKEASAAKSTDDHRSVASALKVVEDAHKNVQEQLKEVEERGVRNAGENAAFLQLVNREKQLDERMSDLKMRLRVTRMSQTTVRASAAEARDAAEKVARAAEKAKGCGAAMSAALKSLAELQQMVQDIDGKGPQNLSAVTEMMEALRSSLVTFGTTMTTKRLQSHHRITQVFSQCPLCSRAAPSRALRVQPPRAVVRPLAAAPAAPCSTQQMREPSTPSVDATVAAPPSAGGAPVVARPATEKAVSTLDDVKARTVVRLANMGLLAGWVQVSNLESHEVELMWIRSAEMDASSSPPSELLQHTWLIQSQYLGSRFGLDHRWGKTKAQREQNNKDEMNAVKEYLRMVGILVGNASKFTKVPAADVIDATRQRNVKDPNREAVFAALSSLSEKLVAALPFGSPETHATARERAIQLRKEEEERPPPPSAMQLIADLQRLDPTDAPPPSDPLATWAFLSPHLQRSSPPPAQLPPPGASGAAASCAATDDGPFTVYVSDLHGGLDALTAQGCEEKVLQYVCLGAMRVTARIPDEVKMPHGKNLSNDLIFAKSEGELRRMLAHVLEECSKSRFWKGGVMKAHIRHKWATELVKTSSLALVDMLYASMNWELCAIERAHNAPIIRYKGVNVSQSRDAVNLSVDPWSRLEDLENVECAPPPSPRKCSVLVYCFLTPPPCRRTQSGSKARRFVREALSCTVLLPTDFVQQLLAAIRDPKNKHYCFNNKCAAFKVCVSCCLSR